MNQQFPAPQRRIDPALEPPFALGRVRVSPATLELSIEDKVEAIEKRMMQVLVALNQRLGEAVSRDELSQLCWDGRVVGDDALNRIISRLRKALALDPGIAIDTIPKVGYRLRVEGAEEAAPSSPAGRGARWPLVAGGAALLLLVLAALAWGSGRDVRWVAENMRPLTREPGIEVFPALSPDGRQLAYASGSGSGAPLDIFLRGTALGETRPVRLTASAASEFSPAWSPDGTRLAFVRQDRDRPCAIVVITPPNTTERVAGGCQKAPTTKIDWLDARTILFSDGPGEGPWRLFALDVDSGRARPLTSPGPKMLGDSAPIASRDGRQIAFRRTTTPGNDDVFLLDPRSGAIRPLGIGGWKGIGMAWGTDSRTLFITSNRGGDFGLWSVDTRGDGVPQRLSHGIVGLGQISADREGNLALETIRTRSNLFAFMSGGPPTPVTASGGNEWDPDIAPDGSVAFGSDVSGANELWVKRPGEEPALLTHLRGSYVYSPRWSPDGRRIAFIGANRGRNDVYTIDADGSRLRKLTGDGVNKGTVAWAGPSELLYTEEAATGWRAVRLGAGGARPVAGSQGLVILRRAPDGALFGRGEAPAVLRLQYRDGRLARANTGISAPIGEAWMPTPAGVSWVEGGFGGPWAIRLTRWDGQSRVIGRLDSLARPALAFRPSDGALVAPRLIEESADLILFEVRKDRS